MVNFCLLMQGALASTPPPFPPHQAGGNVPQGQTRTKVYVREDKLRVQEHSPRELGRPRGRRWLVRREPEQMSQTLQSQLLKMDWAWNSVNFIFKIQCVSCVWCYTPAISVLRRRQEAFLFKATLGYLVRLHLKNQSMNHLFQHNMSIHIHKSAEMPNRHPDFLMSVKYTNPSLRAELQHALTGQPS